MKRVTVQYHYEPDEGWWADSPDFAGFTAVGKHFTDVRSQALDGIANLADDPVIVVEEGGAPRFASPASSNPTMYVMWSLGPCQEPCCAHPMPGQHVFGFDKKGKQFRLALRG